MIIIRYIVMFITIIVVFLFSSCMNCLDTSDEDNDSSIFCTFDNFVNDCQCETYLDCLSEQSTYAITGSSYYVSQETGSDDNRGDREHPYATVSYALSQVEGGDAIFVGDGDYGDLDFGMGYNWTGTAEPIEEVFDEWVTLLPWDAAEPTLDTVILGTLLGEDHLAIPFAQVGNSNLRLRIDGFTITGTIKIYGSRYVSIRNCYIYQKGKFTSLSDSEKASFMGTAGIQVQNGQYIAIENNEITHTGFGIWAMSTDFTCRGNHIHNLAHDGIQIHGGTNLLFEGNVIHDLDDGVGDSDGASYNMHVDGFHIYYVDSADKWAQDMDNLVIRNNLIFHTEAMGIMMQWNDAGTLTNFTWENNIFGPSNGTLIHFGAEVADGFIFRHNTVLYTPKDQWTSHLGRTMGADFADPDDWGYMAYMWDMGDLHADYKLYNNVLTTAQLLEQDKQGGYVANNIYYNKYYDKELDNNDGWKTTTLPYDEISASIMDVIAEGKIPGTLFPGSMAVDAGDVPSGLDPVDDDFAGKARDSLPDVGALEY